MSAWYGTAQQSVLNSNSDGRFYLPYAAALGCLTIGLTSWIVDWLSGGTTALTGLVPVGLFYLLLGTYRPGAGWAYATRDSRPGRCAAQKQQLAQPTRSGYDRTFAAYCAAGRSSRRQGRSRRLEGCAVGRSIAPTFPWNW